MAVIRTLGVAMLALLCSPGLALAGPDVIVGEIDGPSNYGTAGNRTAYSIGTVSCNIGDTPLTWIDCTNANDPNCRLHPVISQNIYRLKGGRFEQIGQAWLKHGFCALQGTVCSACTPGGNCDALFPGCSDPYSSGLNGQQSGLGPKAEVNAFNGTFPYPWLNNGSGSGTLFKRLQALNDDVSPALNGGAVYFVSSMYVQPEDAQFGNGLNSESYRSCSFAAGTFAMSLGGSTQRQKPGIQAWKDSDSTVTISNFDIPGEGRFIVASKATSLGGGQWHYEYAIQNINSDRSGQAFTVPIPVGSVTTNVGFHDVDYHSGEPYALTDWTPSVGASSVSWATQTFAQNANANALRWDTLYNFRFDSNVAPGFGTGTIALFKAGSPAGVSGTVVLPGGSAISNDACANATNVGYGSHPFDTTSAGTDGFPENLCNFSGSNLVNQDVWFRFTACVSGTISVNTCGANYDSKVAIYNAACPTGANTAIACNDDSNACAANSLQSSLTFAAAAGNQYLIRVGGFLTAVGSGNLTISGPSCGPAGPPNDACANAITLTGYGATPFSTALATTDGPAETVACNFFNNDQISQDIWYRWTSCASGTITLSLCGSGFDTEMAVYPNACPTAGGTVIACNDDSDSCGAGSLQSRLTFAAVSGTSYLIRVGGYQTATGAGTLTISGPACPPPGPSNDLCANRIGIALGNTPFSTVGATTDGPAHPECLNAGDPNVNQDIWFNLPSLCPGSLIVGTCGGTAFDTKIAVYDGSGCTDFQSRILGCNDDVAGCGNGLQSRLRIPVRIGQNYTIRVGGFLALTGPGVLNLTCCSGDYDANGTVEVPDIFAFLADWFGGNLRADYDGSGGTAVPDIFAFLTAWFAGCPG